MLRPRTLRALPRISLIQQSRSIHHLPPLEKFQDGIPQLMTREGFNVAWTEYQTLMLEKLNALTAGSADDYKSNTLSLLLKYARQPSMASLFNHASMAHNNHFFFRGLSTETTEIPSNLRSSLEVSFGSIETLKREFIAIGNSMFGPGYVWLVKSPDNSFSLLNTYIAGSPYAGAHWRKQTRDMNTEMAADGSAGDHARRQALYNSEPVNSAGDFGPHSAKAKVAPGGINITPVLCVSTWQHVYLPDWGVLQKKQFLEAWWDRIDWNVVAETAKSEGSHFKMR